MDACDDDQTDQGHPQPAMAVLASAAERGGDDGLGQLEHEVLGGLPQQEPETDADEVGNDDGRPGRGAGGAVDVIDGHAGQGRAGDDGQADGVEEMDDGEEGGRDLEEDDEDGERIGQGAGADDPDHQMNETTLDMNGRVSGRVDINAAGMAGSRSGGGAGAWVVRSRVV